MDDADRAAELSDIYLASALHKVQHRARLASSGNGFCLHCDEPVDGGRRWCDAVCRDSYVGGA